MTPAVYRRGPYFSLIFYDLFVFIELDIEWQIIVNSTNADIIKMYK